MKRSIYQGIIQKLDVTLFRLLTRSVVNLEKNQLAVLLSRVKDISWDIEPDLRSHNWPVSTNVESVDVSHTLLNTQTYSALSVCSLVCAVLFNSRGVTKYSQQLNRTKTSGSRSGSLNGAFWLQCLFGRSHHLKQ